MRHATGELCILNEKPEVSGCTIPSNYVKAILIPTDFLELDFNEVSSRIGGDYKLILTTRFLKCAYTTGIDLEMPIFK